MITLHWTQVSDLRQHANHDGALLVIDKTSNWELHPRMRYEYHASAYRGQTRHDLGTFNDSKAARAKCAEFVNQRQGDSQCTQ